MYYLSILLLAFFGTLGAAAPLASLQQHVLHLPCPLKSNIICYGHWASIPRQLAVETVTAVNEIDAEESPICVGPGPSACTLLGSSSSTGGVVLEWCNDNSAEGRCLSSTELAARGIELVKRCWDSKEEPSLGFGHSINPDGTRILIHGA